MLKNTLINRLAITKVAIALGELNEQVVYVGGAVVSLYIDDPAAEDVNTSYFKCLKVNKLGMRFIRVLFLSRFVY